MHFVSSMKSGLIEGIFETNWLDDFPNDFFSKILENMMSLICNK